MVFLRFVVLDHIREKLDETNKHIDWLFSLEERPFTISTQLETYKRKFFASYRTSQHPLPSPVDNNSIHLLSVPRLPQAREYVNDSSNGLDHDSDEDALKIMATVRAYYQGES